MRIKCLAQEYNTMSPARARTPNAHSKEAGRYRTDTERISNGYGTVTKEKSVLYKRTRSSEHMLVSYAIRVLTRDLKTIQF